MSGIERKSLSRRSLLRGMFQGTAVSVGLPWLECLVPSALAEGAAVHPLRFGTWFWGLGVTPGRWTPTVGEDGQLNLLPESAPLESVKHHLNFMTGFDAILDGRPNHVHFSGTFALRSGIACQKIGQVEGPTFENHIADHMSASKRFKTIDFAATGNPRDAYSFRSAQVRNTPEATPIQLYNRIFGTGFQRPGEGEFEPDPRTLSRLSVLSVVGEQRRSLEAQLGREDRQRLDQYFTSVREVEQQLELQTQEPVIPEACTIPESPAQAEGNYDLANVHANHAVMSRLLALALACDQTRNFNALFSNSASSLHRSGEASSHHLFTHEEFTDSELGYQVETSQFVIENMKGFATFVETLASIPEGDSTLLDNTLVLAHSDTSWAKIHAVQNIPMMTAGSFGGRIKTGQNIVANGDPITRVGLTMQQITGLPVERYGTRSMETSSPVTQLYA